MAARSVIAVSEGPPTRLGRIVLAGEVVDDEAVMPPGLRVMDAHVLSVLLAGAGDYRDADGRSEHLHPGAHTLVPPGFPHWYGTGRGRRWTEVFVVVTGPLFDTVLHDDAPGPRYPRPAPSAEALRGVLRTRPASRRAAEHQLLALADWLLDTGRTPPAEADAELSAAVAHGAGLLADDLTGSVDLHVVAASCGLSYDTFRRHFTRETGSSPSAFRTSRRLHAAATLLRLTDMTHREIARTLGFADEFHFSRRFRAEYGVPPRTYRGVA